MSATEAYGPKDGSATSSPPGLLLQIRDLEVQFATQRGWVSVVDGVELHLKPGAARALVGESGSGKTVTALSITGLIPHPSGRIAGGVICFDGRDLRSLTPRDMRSVRGREIGMIFQEPMTSLNPALTVGYQIAEVVRYHMKVSRKSAWQRAVEMLGLVGIPFPERRARDYPHAFSGGMRQRVMIAMAISCEPKLLVADEPTTALDVTVQAQILDLLKGLQGRLGMAVLLVTHDLGVVADFCDDVTVMYAGQVVETGRSVELFGRPIHPYSAGLLASMPQLEARGEDLTVIPGTVPTPGRFPSGCRFHPRCEHCRDGVCTTGDPALVSLSDGRQTRCVRVQRGDDLYLEGAE